MPDKRYTVIYAVDRQFWVHAYVSIYSLLVNNRQTPFDIRVFATEPDQEFFGHVPELHAIHSDFNLTWVEVENSVFQDLTPQNSHIRSTSTYYRLLAGEILEDEIRQLLYIDCDTIIRGSITQLLNLDINNMVLAASPEYGNFAANQRLGMPADAAYFNAGVLLINLERWRAEDVGRRCLEFIAEQGESLLFDDQDALNALLVGRWMSCGPTFNYMVKKRESLDFNVVSEPDGIVAPGSPAIVHFNGPFKPWNGGSLHRYDRDYWTYRMQTPYADRWSSMRNRLALSNRAYDSRLYNKIALFLRTTPVGIAALKKAKMLIRTTS